MATATETTSTCLTANNAPVVKGLWATDTASTGLTATNAKGQVTAVGSAAIPPSIPTTAQVTAALKAPPWPGR